MSRGGEARNNGVALRRVSALADARREKERIKKKEYFYNRKIIFCIFFFNNRA